MRCEMAHQLLFCPHLSGVVILSQWAPEANCVGSTHTVNLHGPWFLCLFGIDVLFFSIFYSCFFCVQGSACNRGWIRDCRGFFSPLLDPLSWLKSAFFAAYLCWNTAETLLSCSVLLTFSSFSHNLTFSPLSEGLSLNLKLVFHPNCVKLLRCAVNKAGMGRQGSRAVVCHMCSTFYNMHRFFLKMLTLCISLYMFEGGK